MSCRSRLKINCKSQFFIVRVRRELGQGAGEVDVWLLDCSCSSLLVYYPWHFHHWFLPKILTMTFLLYMMELSPGWTQWVQSLTHCWSRLTILIRAWDTSARLSSCWLPTLPSPGLRVWMFVSISSTLLSTITSLSFCNRQWKQVMCELHKHNNFNTI